MKTHDQWVHDTIQLFFDSNWDDFVHIMQGWPELTEEKILENYEIGEFVRSEDGDELCTVCDSGDGEVCRDAFMCDASDVASELYRPERGEQITLLQVMQFMDIAGLNSNVESISMIVDIIDAMLEKYQEALGG